MPNTENNLPRTLSIKEIDALFDEVLKKPGFYKKVPGATYNMSYNWRNGRNKHGITLGQKLEVLYYHNRITILPNGPTQ